VGVVDVATVLDVVRLRQQVLEVDVKRVTGHQQPTTLCIAITVLGVTLDKSLSTNNHVNAVCKSVHYHIRALRHIRSSTSDGMAKMVACALTGSRLRYALFYLGPPRKTSTALVMGKWDRQTALDRSTDGHQTRLAKYRLVHILTVIGHISQLVGFVFG